ncbi:unnamed protein product [Lymnaea stagnalis]|uniref:Uncharacterized protein n=1 Tax=Lymnaea stagnalis TaxID=6523 RepID=A0AAV2IRR1_LYMST
MSSDPKDSCSYYLNLGGFLTESLISPIWYLDMFGFTSNVRFRDGDGSCLKMFLNLSFMNWSKLESSGSFTLRLAITILDIQGKAQDRLVGEKIYKYDGNKKDIDEWWKDLFTVRLKPKEMKDHGFSAADFHTLVIKFDAAIIY